MSKKIKSFDAEFKKDAVQYVHDHPELSQRECADNLGVGRSSLARWLSDARKNEESGSASSSSDSLKSPELTESEKENERLRRELRDTKEALAILKKAISILGS